MESRAEMFQTLIHNNRSDNIPPMMLWNPQQKHTVCGWYTLAPNRPDTSDVSFHCDNIRMLFRNSDDI